MHGGRGTQPGRRQRAETPPTPPNIVNMASAPTAYGSRRLHPLGALGLSSRGPAGARANLGCGGPPGRPPTDSQRSGGRHRVPSAGARESKAVQPTLERSHLCWLFGGASSHQKRVWAGWGGGAAPAFMEALGAACSTSAAVLPVMKGFSSACCQGTCFNFVSGFKRD